MKKRVVLAFVIILVVLCCGCSKNVSSDDKEHNTMEMQADGTESDTESVVETKNEASQMPDKDRVFRDLSEKNCNKITFSGWGEVITLPVIETTFDKARQESKSYIAYCTVAMRNDYYDAKMTYSLTYGYYDIGGWVLDVFKEESREINIIRPDDSYIQDYIKKVSKEKGWYEPTTLNFNYASDIRDKGQNVWLCNYSKVCSRKYADLNYIDEVECYFDTTTGWKFNNLKSTFIYDDWSKIVGKKFYTGKKNGEYYNIEVLKFDNINMEVSVKISGHTDVGYSMKAGSYYDYDKKDYVHVYKTINDLPETIFEEKLEPSVFIEDYYFKKDDDKMYGNGYYYKLNLSDRLEPAVFIGDMDWDYDVGISYFRGFWEKWYYGIPET